jgi:rhodanese-related sulfurtransferase
MLINRRRTMGAIRFATVMLGVCLLYSCGSGGGSGYQDSSRKSPLQAKDPSEAIKEISCGELKDWMMTGRNFSLIDVREDDEWRAGHAAGAVHIARWTLKSKIATVVPDKSARIVLYCLGGVRSAAGAATLQRIGYTNVHSLAGGFRNYEAVGLPIQK